MFVYVGGVVGVVECGLLSVVGEFGVKCES